MKYRSAKLVARAVSLISLIIVVGSLYPAVARASVLSAILASIKGNFADAGSVPQTGNVQTMAFLKPAMNIDPTRARGGGDIQIVDDSALLPEEGPAGTIADIEKPKNSTISTYTVREGDTLSGIALMFDVSPNTIKWANDIPPSGTIRVGQQLTILPVTGVRYTVKKGDTLATIAKKYSADTSEIANYNGIEGALAVGEVIIIPNGEMHIETPAKTVARATGAVTYTTGTQVGYYASPVARYVKTQGIHGYNGVDFGAAAGTPVMASAAGEVIIAKGTGYNGGYGIYVVIQHGNGSQTLYSHLSRLATSAGEFVEQGQVIGYVGSTGRSTGPHLHFEIRNGIRNPF